MVVTHKDVAELLIKNKTIALFQSSSESGPRALGNRSILHNPANPVGKEKVNIVKKRESFRPFAGTVLQEHAHEWFDFGKLKDSPFMMYAIPVLKNKKNLIPCIVHVDGTCRVQTLQRKINENFYDLIKEFYKLTNIPILFNTSFNLAGFPIVQTVTDAIKIVKKSTIDYLYLPEQKELI